MVRSAVIGDDEADDDDAPTDSTDCWEGIIVLPPPDIDGATTGRTRAESSRNSQILRYKQTI
jgi:hypothetical protein